MNERRRVWGNWLAVWLSFLAVSFVSAPIPAVNESHYLTKAKHFWNPDWCARDFFLTSFPAHVVFYATIGWLTKWLSLPVIAVIARCLGLGLLARSWSSLVRRLAERSHSAAASSVVLSAWIFLGLQATGNLSGEWLVGGTESKVFAYAFVFWSLSAWLDRRIVAAGALSGLAISFHPIVGLWHVAAIVVVEFAQRLLQSAAQTDVDESGFATRISPRQFASAIGCLTFLALPGLIPAVQMLIAASPEASFAATYIQVFYRLRHHLDPMDFAVPSWIGYGVMSCVVLWWMLRQWPSAVERRWVLYVSAAGLFALVGLIVGYGDRSGGLMAGYRWRMSLLKFYPFRLFDLLLPLTIAIGLPRLMTSARRTIWIWGIGVIGFGWAMAEFFVVAPPMAWPPAARADWVEVCRWIEANTPPDALFVTPIESDSFKWYAQRAEYANFKDCPQDAAGVTEWNARLKKLTRWSEAGFADERYSEEELRQLGQFTGAQFVMARTSVLYDERFKIFGNGTFHVFRLPGRDANE